MSILFIIIGVLGFFVGCVQMVVEVIKKNRNEIKRRRKGWMITLAAIVVFIVGAATLPSGSDDNDKATASASKADQTDNYKVVQGTIANHRLLVNLAYTAQKLVERYDKIDGVRVDSREISATKLLDSTNQDTGKPYRDTYEVRGVYHWQGRRYSFIFNADFNKDNVNASGTTLSYRSGMSGSVIDTKTPSAEADDDDDEVATASSKADQTDNYKITPGEITNPGLLVNLARDGQKLIERYNKLDGVRVGIRDIAASKMAPSKNHDTGRIYRNTYNVSGHYHWRGRKYFFTFDADFNKNDVNTSGTTLYYNTSAKGPVIDINVTDLDSSTD